ncbi:MASE1 domain-containing protein [Dyella sp.]|uniref:MASE1 domain-containing protein n=1 Tax=Dyella sp. TaxID=1869338 RepID=UPI002ED0E822
MQGAIRGAWLQQGLVALGYAAAYGLLQKVSFAHWVLFAGFRLMALIFVPRRYWAAMAIGELGPVGYVVIKCLDQFGWAWAVLMMVPSPIVLAMPITHWCQGTLRMFPPRGDVRIGVLLLNMLLAAIAWTGINLLCLLVMRVQPGYNLDYLTVTARWFVGYFLGALTVVPLAVLLRQAWRSSVAGERWRRVWDSRLFLETTFLLVPTLCFLLWVSSHADSESARQAARMAMFLPVVFLALRYGWQGAALGGALASVAEVMTMPAHNDPAAVQAEVFMAFAITTMLMLGSRISVLNHRDDQEKANIQDALALARKNIAIGETRLRVASEFLEQIRESIRVGYDNLLTQLRHVPSVDGRGYARQAALAQDQLFRLSDGLYPSGWRDMQLLPTLRQGPFARALSEGGVSYWCDAHGDFSRLSKGLHLAIYRLVGECVAQVCAQVPPTHVRVRLRVSYFCNRPMVGVRVHAWTELDRVFAVQLSDVRLRLAGMGLDWEAATDRVKTYQGRLRCSHGSRGHHVISAVLRDPALRQEPSGERQVGAVTGFGY